MNFLNNLLLKGQLFLAKAPSSGIVNPIDKATNATTGVATSLINFGKAASVIMLIIAGIMWLCGASGSRIGKGILMGVLIGGTLMALASTVVPWIFSTFG